MRKYQNNKRNWSCYFKPIKRHHWSFLIWTLITLMLIFAFAFYTSYQIYWLAILLVCFIFLLLIDWRAALAALVFCFIFLILFYFISKSLETELKEVNRNLQIKKVITKGVIATDGRKNFFVETSENFQINKFINVQSKHILKLVDKDKFHLFLKSERVSFILKNPKINLLETKASLKDQIYQYFLNGPHFYSKYSTLSILGNHDVNNQAVWDKLKNISIIHLFVVSGFHINFLFMLLSQSNRFLKIPRYIIDFIILFLLLPYLWLLNFSISSLRAYIFVFLIACNRNFYKNKIDKLNILAVTMLIFFLWNPFIIYSLSFIFTFMVSYVVLLILKIKEQRFLKLKINLFAWLFSTILITYINQTLNFTGLFTNLIFSPIVVLIYFLSMTFFWIKPVLDNLYFLFDTVINITLLFIIQVNLKIPLEVVLTIFLLLFTYIFFTIWRKNFFKKSLR